jgi:integrase
MARKPTVSYWSSRKAYLCWFQGKQILLASGPDDAPTGKTYLEALAEFQALLQGAERVRTNTLTVREVLEDYLAHISKTKKPGTVEIRVRSFQPFTEHVHAGVKYGERGVDTLTHMDVYRFLEAMERPRKMVRKKEQKGRKPTKWGLGSQRNCLQGLLAAFNWAARSGLIAKNPLTGIEKPSATSRGAESLVGFDSEEVERNHEKILAASPASYRPMLQALKDTGARPGELLAATVPDFNPKLGAIVFRKEMTRGAGRFSHKTSKRKDRVIFLSGPTLDYVRDVATQRDTGRIFLRKGPNGFVRFSITDRFLKLQKKLKMPHLTAYSYRHTFATELLKAGMDVDTLAELMGNSAMVIRQHYSHLLADTKGLRGKLEHFRTAGGTRTSSAGT